VFGVQLAAALQAAEALDASVVDMRFVKPLDEALLLEMAASHSLLVSIEENTIMGGAGSAVGECLAAHGLAVPLLQLGLPDYYVEHARPEEMLAECGLDAAGIQQAIERRLADSRTA
jgi:1-deoxy-D-xylulose-5-phosphate synthase